MTLFSAGDNFSGGLGRRDNCSSSVTPIKGSDFTHVVSMSAYRRTFLVFDDGHVEYCGRDENETFSDTDETEFRVFDDLKKEKIVSVSANRHFVCFTNDKGELFVNEKGMDEDDIEKIEVLKDEKIVFVSSFNSIWAIGNSKHNGCIYKLTHDFESPPAKYVLKNPVIEVYENLESVVAITNEFVALGKGRVSKGSEEFVPIESLSNKRIIKFAVSDSHILCIDIEGRAYSYGENDKGQLGRGDKNDDYENFVQIDALETRKITNISANGKFSLFITSEGDVYGCGLSSDGRTFLGSDFAHGKTSVPQLSDAIRSAGARAVEAACGERFSIVLADIPNRFRNRAAEELVKKDMLTAAGQVADGGRQAEKSKCCLLI
ncbi:hypothetical protein TRFO_38087 [Tritrichomonas foetus]|uniref:Uncharacterized protein n=1 Tax=Tritrichomonas foetus TaxID=1144522 RepID=A0A1J4J9C0_9EUKA|nr:hypothetical protein TRFO_38087 [Tritrichomonas foetus]|eukprot:OHS95786.1 hypothetical protein TRFO_38087 [Tritrichomonas foetus]